MRAVLRPPALLRRVADRVRSTTQPLRLSRRDALAFLFFAGVTVFWFHRLLTVLDVGVLVGPNDASYGIRSYWGAAHVGENPFTLERDPLNGAPEGLPWSRAVQYANALIPGTIWLLHYAVGFTAAANVYLLLGFVLTGFAVYVLLDRLGFHLVGSLLAGYAVAFNPWMIERAYAGHAGFMHAWVFPLLVGALLYANRRGSIWSAIVVGLALITAFYQSSYYGLLAGLVAAVFWVVSFVRERSWAERFWQVTLVNVALVTAVIAFIPALVAWYVDSEAVAAVVSNPVGQLQNLGAAPESYVLPSVRHPVLEPITRAVNERADDKWAENTLYLGWTLIALGIAGAVLVVRKHTETLTTPLRRFFLVSMAVLAPAAFLFSLKRETTVFGVDVPMPAYLFGELTTFWRVFARFGLLVTFALGALAAFALTVLIRRYRHGLAVALLACGLLAFEYLAGFAPAYSFANPDPWVGWLKQQPRGIVAHYPLPTDSPAALQLLARTFYLQQYNEQPQYAIFGSGYGGTREEAIRLVSRYVNDPLTPGVLAAEGVTLVLLHDDVYRQEGKEPPPVPPGFELVAKLGNVRALRLADDVQPVDLPQTLEQNAASIAATQGLPTPEAELETSGSTTLRFAGEPGWRRFPKRAAVDLEWDSERLRRVNLIVRAAATRATTLEVENGSGMVVASVSIGTEPSQPTIGPLPVDGLSQRFWLRTTEGSELLVGMVAAQPLADFSQSIAD